MEPGCAGGRVVIGIIANAVPNAMREAHRSRSGGLLAATMRRSMRLMHFR
jgi:hypothetical protein